MSSEDFRDLFVANFEKLHVKINIWGEDDKEWLQAQGVAACEDFYDMFYDKLKPTATEKQYLINRGEGKLPIKCISDLETEDGTVYDFKFGRGLWGSAVSGEYMTNMTTYALGYFLEHGKIPRIKIIKQKWSGSKQPSGRKKWSHKGFEVDEMSVTQKWIDYYKKVYDEVEKGINAGIFLPASDNNGLCKACSYRKTGYCDIVLM